MTASSLKEVARFPDVLQAEIMQGLLDTHNIESVLFDPLQTQTMPYLAAMNGGARLMVRREDFESAKILVEKALLETEPEDLSVENASQTTSIPSEGAKLSLSGKGSPLIIGLLIIGLMSLGVMLALLLGFL